MVKSKDHRYQGMNDSDFIFQSLVLIERVMDIKCRGYHTQSMILIYMVKDKTKPLSLLGQKSFSQLMENAINVSHRVMLDVSAEHKT